MTKRIFAALAATVLATLSVSVGAQVTAITGGTVHTMGPAGVLDQATVVIADGRIAAVGADVVVPEGAEVIDARGKIVTPGLIDSLSRLGLVEISAVDQTVDYRLKDYDAGASFAVFYGLNPDSTLIPVSRIEGITRTIVAPAPAVDLFAGQGAAIDLSDEMRVLNRSVAVFAALGEAGDRHTGGSRAAALGRFRQTLEEVRYYDAHRKGYDAGASRDYLYGRADMEALVPVVKGQKRLAVSVNRASDISHLLAIAGEFKIKLILIGASEGWKVAKQIAAAGVPVILNPAANLPSSFDGLSATLENAARLNAAGVTIAIGSEGGGGPGGTFNARLITQLAGIAVAYGLPWEAGLAAITVNGAKIWGLDDSYGSLAAGKDADLVVWSGDPLELDRRAEHVFIHGRDIELVSRQTKLRDRYMDLKAGDKPFAYRR